MYRDNADNNKTVFTNNNIDIVKFSGVGGQDTLDVNGNINVTGSYKMDDGDVINTGKCFVGAQVRPTTDIADEFIASASTSAFVKLVLSAKETCGNPPIAPEI